LLLWSTHLAELVLTAINNAPRSGDWMFASVRSGSGAHQNSGASVSVIAARPLRNRTIVISGQPSALGDGFSINPNEAWDGDSDGSITQRTLSSPSAIHSDRRHNRRINAPDRPSNTS